MESLHKRILAEGTALSENVLKVDSFLNHQVDSLLMYEMGTYFNKYFENHGVTKIFTIESSGIAPSAMTAMQMKVPMVIWLVYLRQVNFLNKIHFGGYTSSYRESNS